MANNSPGYAITLRVELSPESSSTASLAQAVIDTGDFEKIGRKVMMMAMDYMERFAMDSAENEIND